MSPGYPVVNGTKFWIRYADSRGRSRGLYLHEAGGACRQPGFIRDRHNRYTEGSDGYGQCRTSLLCGAREVRFVG